MGWVYAGGKTNQKTNAYAKMGETNQKYLSMRVGEIRHREGNFVVFKYLEIPNSTTAMTRAIEGHLRYKMECEGYHNIQNDHFEWQTTPETKMQEYMEFAERAMYHAKQYCQMNNIVYIEHDGDLNARRTCRHRK